MSENTCPECHAPLSIGAGTAEVEIDSLKMEIERLGRCNEQISRSYAGIINHQNAEIERLQSMRRQEASDWMDIDTECRTQAKRVLPPVLIDGDSGSVPSIGDVCELMSEEIERLRAMIEQTADGALVPDCERMFCPKCAGELRLEYDIAYCDSCANPDSGDEPPLPLLFLSCYSTRQAAEIARMTRQ